MEPTRNAAHRWHRIAVAILALLASVAINAHPANAETSLNFSGRLATRPRAHAITSGAGTVTATLTLSQPSGATLDLTARDGRTVASVSGSSGSLSLTSNVAAGNYSLIVVGAGPPRGNISYELAVRLPDVQSTTTTAPTTTTTTTAPTTTTTTTTTAPPTTTSSIHDIPASIASDCSVDVTAALNFWFRSVPDGSAQSPNVLRFGAGRCYRVDGTLVNPRDDLSAPERHYLVFDGNGSTLDGRYFKVPWQSAPKINHSMWMFGHAVGITIEGFTMHGQHPNPCNLDTKGNCRDGGVVNAYEWYAGVAFEGGQDIVVRENRIYSMYGDGVNVAQGSRCWQGAGVWGADHPENVLIVKNLIDGTGRHGVSISAGHNVQVVGNTFDRISYQVSDLEYECAQPVRDITFDHNIIRRHYLGFIAATTGGEYQQCPPEGFNGGFVIVDNVMERSGVTTTPPIWIGSTQPSYCAANDKADVQVQGNTLLYDHAEGTHSAVQVDTTSGAIVVAGNRIVQPGSSAAVDLTRVSSATSVVLSNDMHEAAWAYSLDGVAHSPAVHACGNITSSGSNLPILCA